MIKLLKRTFYGGKNLKKQPFLAASSLSEARGGGVNLWGGEEIFQIEEQHVFI